VATFRRGTVELKRVPLAECQALSEDVLRYLAELDGLAPTRKESTTRTATDYRYLDSYWRAPERLPLFVLAEGVIAGFALVRAIAGDWNIAEFSIRPELRRKGVGRAAIAALADLARLSESDFLRTQVESWNSGASRFWGACGFEPIGRETGTIELVCKLRPVSLLEERLRKPNVP